jgi:hypothetical protein
VCSTGHVDLVRRLGAGQVIDYTKQDFTAGPARYDLALHLGAVQPACRRDEADRVRDVCPSQTDYALPGMSPSGSESCLIGPYFKSWQLRLGVAVHESSPTCSLLPLSSERSGRCTSH